LGDLPQWVYTYGHIGLVKVCGAPATGVSAVVAACANKNDGGAVSDDPTGAQSLDHQPLLMYEDFDIDKDAVIMASPEIANMPYIVSGLITAGGLAAALSTADGLLLAIANSFSHDIYFTLIDTKAPPGRRLLVARLMLVVIAALAAFTASTKPSDILSMVAWAFSMAASGNFPPLVLGIWWKRANAWGAIAGMMSGFAVCLTYVFGTRYGDMPLWFSSSSYDGLPSTAAGVVAIPVGFLVMVVVSLLTPPPSEEILAFVENMRHFNETCVGEAAHGLKDQGDEVAGSIGKDFQNGGKGGTDAPDVGP